MFNVYKNKQKSANRKQESDGSKNASHDMGYQYEACDQISDFCHQQLLRKMRRKISWKDGRTDRGKTVYHPSPSSGGAGYNYVPYLILKVGNFIYYNIKKQLVVIRFIFFGILITNVLHLLQIFKNQFETETICTLLMTISYLDFVKIEP